jgi:uncharacterized membrane protein
MEFPDAHTNAMLFLRWVHFLAGITWIGLLYFFNLVNVPFMKEIDGATKGKVVPALMPRALWWFRWGAVVTVLVGVLYYMDFLWKEPEPGKHFLWWLVLVLLGYGVVFAVLQPAMKLQKDGRVLAVPVALVSVVFAVLVVCVNGKHEGASAHTVYIGIGGGYGVWMLLNVWGVIWRNQKRIIAWTKENAEKGTAVPPESAALARQAFLASRTNAWLSVPMLFFMAAAGHWTLLWPVG